VKNAQNKATRLLIAENMLAQQSATMPEVDPLEYANALVSFAKKSAAAIGSGAVV